MTFIRKVYTPLPEEVAEAALFRCRLHQFRPNQGLTSRYVYRWCVVDMSGYMIKVGDRVVGDKHPTPRAALDEYIALLEAHIKNTNPPG